MSGLVVCLLMHWYIFKLNRDHTKIHVKIQLIVNLN